MLRGWSAHSPRAIRSEERKIETIASVPLKAGCREKATNHGPTHEEYTFRPGPRVANNATEMEARARLEI
jgi:hypothetical protein